MTEFSLSAFEQDIASASAALQDFAQGPAQRAANDVSAAFERAGERIARAMGGAAITGETAFRRMAKTILEEFARLALDRLLSAGGGSSARSAEAFAAASNPVTVNIIVGSGGDPNAVMRHQGQIAAAIARAVAYGSRNL